MSVEPTSPVRYVCPDCRCELSPFTDALVCVSDACRKAYPIVEGIPVLIPGDGAVLELTEWASALSSSTNSVDEDGSAS